MAETDNQANTESTEQVDATTPRFIIQRVYVKDSSFEAPSAPEVFRDAYKPQIQFNMNTKTNNFDGSLYEVVLTMTVEAKGEDDKIYFIVEVQQAGVFEIVGVEGEDLTRALYITCPSILFPYGRESMDNLVNKGSFPSLMLSPVNFEAAFQQAMEQQNAQGEGAEQTNA